MNNSLRACLATWFGCGYSPVAPGTVGAAAAVVIAYLLGWDRVTNRDRRRSRRPDRHLVRRPWKRQSSGRKDPGHVVIDEVAGQWITLAGATAFNWKSCLIGFLLFRLFDIWKPAPVRQLERLPDGPALWRMT